MLWGLGWLSCLCVFQAKTILQLQDYTMTNRALIVNNKGILYAVIGAPRRTHDSRMLKRTQLYQGILRGNVILNIQLHLEDSS